MRGQREPGVLGVEWQGFGTVLGLPGCLTRRRLSENRFRGAQSGAPLMRGAPMSASYDMEAAQPIAGRLLEKVQLTHVNAGSTEVRPLPDAGLRPTRWVA